MTLRLDRYNVTLKKVARTEEGYLVFEAPVAKPGVMEYQNPDGSTRRELVLPDELSRQDSLATLAFKPLVVEHPPEGFVNPQNVGRYGAGIVGEEIIFDAIEGYAKVKIIVQREDAILDIQSNARREFSPGYYLELEETPGEHPIYGRYDAIQRNRKYNHVALTERARGGPDLTLRMDSAVMSTAENFDSKQKPPARKKRMAQVNLDGVTVEIEDVQTAGLINKFRKDMEDKEKKLDADLEEAKKAIDEFKGRIAEMEAQKQAMETQIAEMKGQLDVLLAPAPAPEMPAEDGYHQEDEMMGMDPEYKMDSKKWFKDRSELLVLATQYNVDGADDLDNLEIRRAIVEKYTGTTRADSCSVEIKAAFDMIKIQEARRSDSYQKTGEVLRKGVESRGDSFAQAENNYIQRLINASKKGA
jgi:hypothetical protein